MQACISWYLKYHPWSLSIWLVYLYIVLCSCNSLMMTFLCVCGDWRKSKLGQTQCPPKPRHLEPSLGGRGPIKSFCPQWLTSGELQWMDSCSFGSCLGPCLEHTATALTKSFCFKGVLATLAICHPLRKLWWPLFLCCIYWRADC